MLLCLDVGNTHIMSALFDDKKLILRFRYATAQIGTADQFGLFLRDILKTNDIDYRKVKVAALCSVVPGVNFTIRHAFSLYFPEAEYFVLQAGVKTGINIKYKNPAEVGADLIAGAIGAVEAFPNKNLIVADLGTATTLVAVTKKGDFLGGVILAGLRLSMESLKSNTAKLMEVDIEEPDTYLGQSTRECIQRGLYFGHLGALREIIAGYNRELFAGEPAVVIGTGGFSHLFKDQKVFDAILPDVVSQGIRIAYEKAKAAEVKVKAG
jgi:type III pantothenate kinase